MTTFLDTIGILDYFSPIFAFLLVLAVVYALLSKTKVLGDSRVVDMIIAFVAGILILLVPDIVELINTMMPIFVIVFVFSILLIVMFMMFGLGEKDIGDYFRKDKTVNYVIIAVAILILLGSVFIIFGQRALQTTSSGNETAAGGFETNLFNTIFNAKMLGLVVIFTVAIFAIAFLGGQGGP